MTEDVTVNDVVALLVEVTVLVLLGAWGFRSDTTLATRLLLGLGAPAVAVTAWALFAAPNSVFDGLATELAVKVLVLGAGVFAAFAVFPMAWAVAFGVVVVVNTLLLHVGPFAR